MKISLIIFIFVVLIVALIVFLYYQNNQIDITRYEIEKSVNNSFVIAHLSDLHSKPFLNVLNKLKEEKPDIICITGDYVNDHNKNKDKMLDFGKELLKICPVYYITGNHERRLDSFNELMEELSSIGFTVLLDEIVNTEINGNNISILGLDENQANFEDYKARRKGTFEYKSNSHLFERLNKQNTDYKIVLSHFPENFEKLSERNYKQYNFDLQLSGHAHGGQFILPFIGPIYSPGQGIFPKYARGSFGTSPKLIISRGLGNAEFPFRLFNHPEINIIKLDKPLEK